MTEIEKPLKSANMAEVDLFLEINCFLAPCHVSDGIFIIVLWWIYR